MGCTRVPTSRNSSHVSAEHSRVNGRVIPPYSAAQNVVQTFASRLDIPTKRAIVRQGVVNRLLTLPSVTPVCFISDTLHVMKTASDTNGRVFRVLTMRPAPAVRWWDQHKAEPNRVWPPKIRNRALVTVHNCAHRPQVVARIEEPLIPFAFDDPLVGDVALIPWMERDALRWAIFGCENGNRTRQSDSRWGRVSQ